MRTTLFAQSVLEYSGIAASTTARDVGYSVKSWFRSNTQLSWMLIGGLLLLIFLLRKKRRRY